MKYLFCLLAILVFLNSGFAIASQKGAIAAPRSSTREQRRLEREKVRQLKDVERVPIFNQQTPNQQEFYREFMLGWDEFLQQMHPRYIKYLPVRKAQVAEIYAQYTDYQLQLAQLEEEKRLINYKMQEIEKKIKWLEIDSSEIRRLEDERAIQGIPLDRSEL